MLKLILRRQIMRKKNLILIIGLILAVWCVCDVIMAQQAQSPQTRKQRPATVTIRKKRDYPIDYTERPSRYYRRYDNRSWEEIERSREARDELRQMREDARAKVEERQARLREESEKEASDPNQSENQKIVILKRKITRLEDSVDELSKRVDLLERIIESEAPVPEEPPAQETNEKKE